MVLLLFGGVGCLLFIAGLTWGWQRYDLLQHSEKTQGQVVAYYESESVSLDIDDRRGLGHRIVHFIPVVEFATSEGRTIRFRSATGSNIPDYEVGAIVDVVYDPARPAR